MFSNQAAELSVNRPVAAIDAIRGDRVDSKFIVGTSSVRASEDNHLLLLRFHSEANHLGIDARLSHPTGPVERIRTSPSDPSYVLTTAENDSAAATLWKIPSDVIDRAPADADDYGGVNRDDDDDDYYDHDGPNNSGSDNDNDNDKVTAMEKRATLQASAAGVASRITDVAWRGNAWDDDPSPESSMGDVATLCSDGTLTQWDVAFGSAESTRNCTANLSSSLRSNLQSRIAWDPHHSDVTAISTGDIVQLVDWREPPLSSSLSSLPSSSSTTMNSNSSSGHPHHRYGITDLDYNPNKPNLLVTSGKDGLLKFWDLRKTGSGYYDVNGCDGDGDINDDGILGGGVGRKKKQRPLLVARGGHRHWATRVLYNPFHDQLVLSAGTDSLVNLWRMSTISSAPLLTFDDEQLQMQQSSHQNMALSTLSGEETASSQQQQQQEGPNVRVSRYEHMDSVNAIAWSAADAWIYVSASYDGKVVLNHVPSKEKYKILL
mmetsp:Transcript_300/g.780  ORF Transcript_300/g.780 Transcript_300/m.780 type:complete len:490 (-) Transcript_300:268-1737(-)